MMYAILFSVAGVLLFWRAGAEGGWAYALAWPGLSLLVLALAYGGLGPRLLGKRGNGTMAWWAIIILLPYLLLIWLTWCVRRQVSRRPGAQEIVPGLWLGRRPTCSETPPDGLVIDMTAEFPANRRLRRQPRYLCVPTLDATTTDDQVLLDLVRRIAAEKQPVLIHCALGYGRSACVMAAVLLAKGLASRPQAAVAKIRQVRPGVKLNSSQRKQLTRLCAGLL